MNRTNRNKRYFVAVFIIFFTIISCTNRDIFVQAMNSDRQSTNNVNDERVIIEEKTTEEVTTCVVNTEESSIEEDASEEVETSDPDTEELITEEPITEEPVTEELTTEDLLTEELPTEDLSIEELATEDTELTVEVSSTENEEQVEMDKHIIRNIDGSPYCISHSDEITELMCGYKRMLGVSKSAGNQSSQAGTDMTLRFMNRFHGDCTIIGLKNGRVIKDITPELLYVTDGETNVTCLCVQFGVLAKNGDTFLLEEDILRVTSLTEQEKEQISLAIGLARNAYLNPETCTYEEWRNLMTTQFLVWYYLGNMTWEQANTNCNNYGNWDEFRRVTELVESYDTIPSYMRNAKTGNPSNHQTLYQMKYSSRENGYVVTFKDENHMIAKEQMDFAGMEVIQDNRKVEGVRIRVEGDCLHMTVPTSIRTGKEHPLQVLLRKRREVQQKAGLCFLQNITYTGTKPHQNCVLVRGINTDPILATCDLYAEGIPGFMISFQKRDGDTGTELEGAVFALSADEDIYDDSNNTLVYKKGSIIAAQSSGQADCFGVYQKPGWVYFTAGTDINSRVRQLYPGTYSITEVSPCSGYTKMKPIKVAVTRDQIKQAIKEGKADNDIEHLYQVHPVGEGYEGIWANNYPTKCSLKIRKRDEITRQPLHQVTFQLYARNDIQYPDGKTGIVFKKGDPLLGINCLATVVTDKNGIAIFSNGKTHRTDLWSKGKTALYPGDYVIKEVHCKNGYVYETGLTNVTIQGKADQNGEYLASVEISNRPQKAEIVVHKTDQRTGSDLEHVTFELYAEEDIQYPDGITGVVWKKGTKLGQQITDANGIAVFREADTSNKYLKQLTGKQPLLPGCYRVKETGWRQGYVQYQNEQFITLKATKEEGEEIVQATVELQNDVQEKKIQLRKIDSDSREPLSGILFGLYAAETIEYPDGITGVIFNKDQLLATEATDKMGQIAFCTGDTSNKRFADTGKAPLVAGAYYIKELETDEQHELLKEPIPVILQDTQLKQEEVCYELLVENHLKAKRKFPITIHKYLEYQNGETQPLQEIGFVLYPLEKLKEQGVRMEENLDQTVTLLDVEQIDWKQYDKYACIVTETGERILYTDEEGNAKTIPMDCGQYVIRESSYPEYVKKADPVIVTIKEEQGECEVEVSISNYLDTELQIRKVDITSEKELPGATLQLLQNQEIIDEWVSEREPHVVAGLEPGVYQLKEILPPEGYLKADMIEFTLEETGKVQTVIMKDEYTRIRIEKREKGTEQFVEGAKLALYDDKGNLMMEWVSGKKAKTLERLKPGKYILKELEAPAGYELAESLPVEIKETGKMQVFVFYNELKATSEEETEKETEEETSTQSEREPKTGDDSNVLSVIIVGVFCSIVVGSLLRKQRRKNW